jgi:hypothetical protein
MTEVLRFILPAVMFFGTIFSITMTYVFLGYLTRLNLLLHLGILTFGIVATVGANKLLSSGSRIFESSKSLLMSYKASGSLSKLERLSFHSCKSLEFVIASMFTIQKLTFLLIFHVVASNVMSLLVALDKLDFTTWLFR